MQRVTTENRDAVALDGGTNANIEIPTTQEQAIIQRTLQPAAAAFTSTKQESKCDLQLVQDSFDLDSGKWTRMAKNIDETGVTARTTTTT